MASPDEKTRSDQPAGKEGRERTVVVNDPQATLIESSAKDSDGTAIDETLLEEGAAPTDDPESTIIDRTGSDPDATVLGDDSVGESGDDRTVLAGEELPQAGFAAEQQVLVQRYQTSRAYHSFLDLDHIPAKRELASAANAFQLLLSCFFFHEETKLGSFKLVELILRERHQRSHNESQWPNSTSSSIAKAALEKWSVRATGQYSIRTPSLASRESARQRRHSSLTIIWKKGSAFSLT